MLTKAEVLVDSKKVTKEEVLNLMLQKPNNTFIFGYPLKLEMYNLAKVNADSSYQAWLLKKPERYDRLSKLLSEKQVARLGQAFFVSGLSNILKENGEPPVILDTLKTIKSTDKFETYYFDHGYLDAVSSFKIDSVAPKKATITYSVTKGNPYFVDSITYKPSSFIIDSLYQLTKNQMVIGTGKQYNLSDFANERTRLTTFFRNHGVYKFQENYINYNIYRNDDSDKLNVDLIIDQYSKKSGDSLVKEPFDIYKISQVNVFTDNAGKKEYSADSISYNNINIYSSAKLNFKPKAITDAIFINPGNVYSDYRRSITTQSLSNLKIFNYPRIEYIEDVSDSTKNALISNIYLVPLKKYTFNAGFDLMHSNIQDFGILGTAGLTIRNVFKGAEILEISGKANIGSSRELANPDDVFFNLSEFGGDVKLTFPKILMPFKTTGFIPKTMFPTTQISAGVSRQRNIGLDKESFTGILSYSWFPKRYNNIRIDLLNIQYINNLNPYNYFLVYRSTYRRLNSIAERYTAEIDPSYLNENGTLEEQRGTIDFMNSVLNNSIPVSPEDRTVVRSISERYDRLTENNLIVASNITYQKSTRKNLTDYNFWSLRTKFESAGALLSLLDRDKSKTNQNDNSTIFNVAYAEYVKGEVEFIRNWQLSSKKVLATRFFAGLAIPYGNSSSIPFIRSYYAGGTNDNRAWLAYSLGPGSSGGVNDFNEANMKLAFSLEYRFNISGNLNGAIFTDIGNIWNVFDEVKNPKYKFQNLSSLKELAVGTGFGARYDFNFFIFRLDIGFKTYNPAYEYERRWLRDYNFSKAVINIGINYPF
uniref:translocation and assembly module lipoprotein TamL n=1 Tax=Flavobacterium agricola TaxID=2870839 RepID=UPI002221A068|nr:BamA/TamA family outer membrane protein [Flavobacterium agricola]